MAIVEITSLHHPGVEVFGQLTERQLRNHQSTDSGLFIAESPKVIKVALSAGYTPTALLCEQRHLTGDAAAIISQFPELTVYTGQRELLAALTGYTLTRGVLCAMKRRPLPSVEDLCRDARRIVVIDGVCDTTNIGSIFRSAAALGADGVLLTSTTCDPLNRRSIRVSMGTVFLVPWTWISEPLSFLDSLGLTTVALALSEDALDIDNPCLLGLPRMAMIVGTEGDGLSRTTIEQARYVARIPMAHSVDSLNVGAATALALWQFRGTEGERDRG
ncbi:MAG: RNA methyltransferase [Bacteroidales bacterium]|nr:RNA methyltransferase [Bacteroidales bacterium]